MIKAVRGINDTDFIMRVVEFVILWRRCEISTGTRIIAIIVSKGVLLSSQDNQVGFVYFGRCQLFLG